jgi:hypothetical protein
LGHAEVNRKASNMNRFIVAIGLLLAIPLLPAHRKMAYFLFLIGNMLFQVVGKRFTQTHITFILVRINF